MKEILERVSIREYLDNKVEKNLIKDLLLAGSSAPSARNQRAVEFLVLDDKEKLNKLSEANRAHVFCNKASICIVVLVNKSKVISPLYVDQDASAATENILLEATSLGLGTCWLGIAPNEERKNNYQNILNLSDNYYAFSMITIGYPKEKIIKERKYDASIMHDNEVGKKYE